MGSNSNSSSTTQYSESVAVLATRRGDYLLRECHWDRGRYATQSEAHAAAAALVARREQESVDGRARVAAWRERERAIDAAAPALRTRQLAWQEWRSGQYGDLCERRRRRDAYARHGLRDRAETSETYAVWGNRRAEAATERHAQEDADYAEQESAYYGTAVALDGRIKDARRAGDLPALDAALSDAERVMRGGR